MFAAPATGGPAVNDEFSPALRAFLAKAKFYDIAALILWLTGGIARKGNANKEKDHDNQNRKTRRNQLSRLHRLERRKAERKELLDARRRGLQVAPGRQGL